MNPYQILDIPPGASADDIKSAYHRLAKQWHPDRFSGAEKAEAETRFRQVAEAFNMLKDSGRRAEIDQRVAQNPSPAPENPSVPAPPTVRTADDWFADAKEAQASGDRERALGLVQYALRLDASKVEYFMLLANLLDEGQADVRTRIKAHENVHRMVPKDPDTLVSLAELYEAVGMEARASRMWDLARTAAPGHRAVKARQRAQAAPRSKNAPAPPAESPSLGDQFRELLSRFTKKEK